MKLTILWLIYFFGIVSVFQHFNPLDPNAPFSYALKTVRFSDVFSGQKKRALGTNGLIVLNQKLLWKLHFYQKKNGI